MRVRTYRALIKAADWKIHCRQDFLFFFFLKRGTTATEGLFFSPRLKSAVCVCVCPHTDKILVQKSRGLNSCSILNTHTHFKVMHCPVVIPFRFFAGEAFLGCQPQKAASKRVTQVLLKDISTQTENTA